MMRYQNPMEIKKPRRTIVYVLLRLITVAVLAFVVHGLQSERTDATPQPISYIEYGSRRIPSVVPAAVDYTAPPLQLTNLDGQPVALVDLGGQVTLVNQWAIFCPFCEAEMPEFEAYLAAHAPEGFALVTVNAGDRAEEVAAYVEKHDIGVPVWLDPKSEIFRAFKNTHLPSSYVIDRRGQVRLAWNGPISLEMLEMHVTPLLSE